MSARLREMARETVAIAERGSYPIAGSEVVIADQVARAVAGTRLYRPGDALPAQPPDASSRVTGAAAPPVTRAAAPPVTGAAVPPVTGAAARPVTGAAGSLPVEVTNESSLAAARRLGGDVACLVFASARTPGGGFLTGAKAQEESLARSSALYLCQRAQGDFYAYHRAHADLTYSDRVIYSPGVPVFRDDRGDLLPAAYPVSFLTAAAPNRSAIERLQPERQGDIPAVLARRAARVLDVAAAHGHRRLVLGAWGCGVFGNEPSVVAETFAIALRNGPRFERVVFAVLDRQAGTPTYAAFARAFSPGYT